ncbi:MAG: hypothetical protein ACFFB5_06930 [Promethearchaeota archaeon]
MKKFTDDRYLKIAFLIGGIYDIVLGLPMLFLPDLTTTLLNVSKPEPIIWVQTIGVFLIIIGYFLLIATQDARRFAFIGVGSAVIRLGYAILTLLSWITIGIEMGYMFVAMTDTLTAIILLVPLILTEDVSWKSIWQL